MVGTKRGQKVSLKKACLFFNKKIRKGEFSAHFHFMFTQIMLNFQGVRTGGFWDHFRKNEICSVFTMYWNNFLRTSHKKKWKN